MDRRTSNNYMHDQMSKSNLNNISNMSNTNNGSINASKTNFNEDFNNSISGMGKNIRTNLNNIDYATSCNTIARRPHLHPSIYEHSILSNNNNNETLHNANQNIIMNQNEMFSMQKVPPSLPPHQHHHPQQIQSTKYEYDMGGNNFEFDQDIDDDIIPDWVPLDRCLEKVITTFDYDGAREDELSFKENMFIYVIKKNDDHWYEGIMKSENGIVMQGLYPYNYARCIRKYVDDSKVSAC